MRYFVYCLFLLLPARPLAQVFNYAFNRITTEDGMGLRSNAVQSIYQDGKGFIWIGNSNGLQRFDGSKFINFDPYGTKPDPMPDVAISSILPADSGKMWIGSYPIKEFGIFDPATFRYHKIPLVTSRPLPPRAEYKLWQDGYQQTYISVTRYGKILKYDSRRKEFNENTELNGIPFGWKSKSNVFHDTLMKQYWIVCDSGLCVYDEGSRQMWNKQNNPRDIPLLKNLEIQHAVSQFYIDRQRRHWVFNWTNGQNFYCFDSSGRGLKDTAGLNGVNTSYAELNNFFETRSGSLFIYGLANLYVHDKGRTSFTLYRQQLNDIYGIGYEDVNHVYEDRDGVIWVATDQGIYHSTPPNEDVVNVFLSYKPGEYNVTDIIETASGEYWLYTWGKGVVVLNQQFQRRPSPLYHPADSSDYASYLSFMKKQLTELLTNYGEIMSIWFDGHWDQTNPEGNADRSSRIDWKYNEIYKLIHTLQPQCMIGNNHHLDPIPGEDFQMFERDLPGENKAGLSFQQASTLPLETCETLNGSWGYNITDRNYKTVTQVIQMAVGAAGRNANLLLNVGPMPNGEIQPEFRDTLAAAGKWLQKYGQTIYGTRGGPMKPQPWGVTTQSMNNIYIHLMYPYETENVFIPIKTKPRSVKLFGSDAEVKYIMTKDGISINASGLNISGPDTIIWVQQ